MTIRITLSIQDHKRKCKISEVSQQDCGFQVRGHEHVLIELLDDAAVQAMTCLIAQRLTRDVPNLRQVMYEQVYRLCQERREEVVGIAKHAAVVRDDCRRNHFGESGRVVLVASTGRAERRQEQSEVLPCCIPILEIET